MDFADVTELVKSHTDAKYLRRESSKVSQAKSNSEPASSNTTKAKTQISAS